ncbi:nucleotide exchange factor GrpE [Candidatus Woesearchaeota archaeon]|nr:nucleotide exchange factor GrpE [Candidatus Woesearchaeota archaeon]
MTKSPKPTKEAETQQNQAPTIPSAQNSLVKDIEEQKKRVEEYTDHLRRLQAEFENYMKRVEREKAELNKYGQAKLLIKLLPVVDDFERALQLLQPQDALVKQGIEMIYKQLKKVLEEEGVKVVEAKGQKFDPYKHEILDLVAGEKEGMIMDELQKGYIFKDKVLRTSKVRVAKGEQNVQKP